MSDQLTLPKINATDGDSVMAGYRVDIESTTYVMAIRRRKNGKGFYVTLQSPEMPEPSTSVNSKKVMLAARSYLRGFTQGHLAAATGKVWKELPEK